MTEAEKEKLAQKGLVGVRLSCQITCTADMTVRAISRLTGSGRADAGGTPAARSSRRRYGRRKRDRVRPRGARGRGVRYFGCGT